MLRKANQFLATYFLIFIMSNPANQIPKAQSKKETIDCCGAAKSLQSCLTLCDPIDGSPAGSPVPGILQARTLEWVAISFSSAWKWKVKVKSLSRVRLLATPGTVAHQAPLFMGFSRQECWSGVPLPSPNDWLAGLKKPNKRPLYVWKEWKDNSQIERKFSKRQLLIKDCYPKYTKSSRNSSIRKWTTQYKIGHITEDIEMASKHTKRHSTSYVTVCMLSCFSHVLSHVQLFETL